MVHILKHVRRLAPEQIQAFQDQSTATVHEAMGRRGAIDSSIRPLIRGMRICGNAVTVSCHTADNIMLIKAISMARSGDVVVADMGVAPTIGPFGEVMATECVSKGLAGLVVNSSVRDTREIIALGFPVFSKGVGISGTAKATLGTINHPIAFGGEIIHPGDLILGDDDGLVVVPHEEVNEVLQLAKQRTEKEAVVMEQLRKGGSLFDIYGYQKKLDELGCKEEAD